MIGNKLKFEDTFFSGIQIKHLFVAAFVSGIFFILLGSVFGMLYLSVIMTIAVMIGYFLTGRRLVDKELLTNEQFADSNYYLGFLFTLISLASSLYLLSSDLLAGGLLTRLIGQFGISISTTIVGLSMRIYLLSFSPNISSNIESFNLMIMEKLQLLNDHIGHSIDQTKTFSRVIDEKLEIFTDQTLKSVERYNQRLVESLEQTSINNIFTKIYDDMDKIHQQEESRVSEIYENITALHKSYEEQNLASAQSFQKTMKESEKWIEEFNSTMGSSAGSIANSNAEMRKVISSFNEFVRDLPMLFRQVNDMFAESSKTLTDDLSEKNRALIEAYAQQKDRQNKILIERLLGENQKVIDSFIANGVNSNQEILEKLNSFNRQMMESFVQNREAGNEKIINDITVLNNKVIQSIGSKTERLHNQVVDAIMTSSTKVLGNFISSQAQKNETMIDGIVEENRRMLDALSEKLLLQQAAIKDNVLSQSPKEETPAVNIKLVETMLQENRRMLEALNNKFMVQEETDKEKVLFRRQREETPAVNEKMRSHGNVKLPKQ
ncbi:hypothetical protein [Sulfurimonas sp. HSL3-7]|uniref:hypothetical protein n=1 Tax=Sulfonitrofixus jiaomeiensis TaxID=3131938 RepID=UPI0031F73651